MRVGIVGAGTAGSTAGILLSRLGHEVDIFEKIASPRAVGAGIMLQPTGQHVLREMGLLESIVAAGTPLTRLQAVRRGGRGLMHLEYPTGTQAYGLHRGVLFEALLKAVDASPANLRCGVEIERVSRGFIGAQTASQSRLIDARGHAWGPYDLVLICDGARSELRGQLEIPITHFDYPWGVLWFVAEDPDRRYRDRLYQVVTGTREMLGLLPTGLGPQSDMPLVSFFWSIRDDAVATLRREGFTRWKENVGQLCPEARPVLEQIEKPSQLIFGDYRRVRMSRWHDGGVVVLGDAAHSMSPHLGQGANLALCDAAVLADLVRVRDDAPWVAREYTKRRRAHLSYYQWATQILTPFFQHEGTLFGALRDIGFPIATRLGWTRQAMMSTMAGARLGIFGGQLELPTFDEISGERAGLWAHDSAR